MLTVTIVKDSNKLTAQVQITDPDFEEDLQRIRSLPWDDRRWRPESKLWLVYDAERFMHIPEIRHAIADWKRQLRMDI